MPKLFPVKTADLKTRVGLMDRLVAGGTIDFTLTNGQIDKHRNRDLANQHGNNWVVSTAKRETKREMIDSQTSFPHVWPGVSRDINDNYCVSAPMCRWLTWGRETVKSVNLYQPHRTGLQKQPRDCKLVSVSPDRISVRRDSKCLSIRNKCKLSCCKSCTYCLRIGTKERGKSGCYKMILQLMSLIGMLST